MSSSPQSSEIKTSGTDLLHSLNPIGEFTAPAGYAAPFAVLQSERKKEEQTGIAKAAAQVLQNPLLMRRLSDRVYELMLEDLRNQRERSRNYGGSF